MHPHKIRRTMATMAIDKGMSIEQVEQYKDYNCKIMISLLCFNES